MGILSLLGSLYYTVVYSKKVYQIFQLDAAIKDQEERNRKNGGTTNENVGLEIPWAWMLAITGICAILIICSILLIYGSIKVSLSGLL